MGYSWNMKTRGKGAGSLYQRKDGLWCAAIELEPVDGKRRKKVVASKDRNVVEAKLQEWSAGYQPPKFKTRPEYLREARKIATHTPREWSAKVRASSKHCRYCETELHYFNMVKDHMIALEVGGSDGIDNVQPICWECNVEKATTPPDEFVYKGTKPRPFSVLPIRRKEYERVMEKRRARQG